ncbi:hypothetical protein JIQ42_07903 [Leishmania sp. Namibia]|uniref:hypothetical protein n=1 Tax=Leishmania sp. Namibia TaxID=2802991 RepID=UPI001B6172BB|nr:hypothetical protein JIQ42_07903 [Leishmania sp. Namibia]
MAQKHSGSQGPLLGTMVSGVKAFLELLVGNEATTSFVGVVSTCDGFLVDFSSGDETVSVPNYMAGLRWAVPTPLAPHTHPHHHQPSSIAPSAPSPAFPSRTSRRSSRAVATGCVRLPRGQPLQVGRARDCGGDAEGCAGVLLQLRLHHHPRGGAAYHFQGARGHRCCTRPEVAYHYNSLCPHRPRQLAVRHMHHEAAMGMAGAGHRKMPPFFSPSLK